LARWVLIRELSVTSEGVTEVFPVLQKNS